MAGTKFAIKQEGIDYYFLIMKHIDRMSEGLKEGLQVGEINTPKLISYYNQVLHLEALLVPFLDEEYFTHKKKVKEELPSLTKTYSGKLSSQIEFLTAVTKLFKLLMIFAYNTGVLKIKITKEVPIELGLFG